MPFSFGDTLDGTTNVQDSGIWSVLLAAVQERLAVVPYNSYAGTYVPSPLSSLGTIDVGAYDPVSAATYTSIPGSGKNLETQNWFSQNFVNSTVPGNSGVLGMQVALANILPNFLNDHDYTVEGNGDYSIFQPVGGYPEPCKAAYNMVTARAAAGLPGVNPWALAGGDEIIALYWNNGFRRRRPREISATNATSDTVGNPVDVGMKAYFLDGHNLLYYCTASGSWRRAVTADGPVDILDNTAEVPNSIGYPDGTGSSFYQANGDYLCWEVLDEIQQLTNLLKVRLDVNVGDEDGGGVGATNLYGWNIDTLTTAYGAAVNYGMEEFNSTSYAAAQSLFNSRWQTLPISGEAWWNPTDDGPETFNPAFLLFADYDSGIERTVPPDDPSQPHYYTIYGYKQGMDLVLKNPAGGSTTWYAFGYYKIETWISDTNFAYFTDGMADIQQNIWHAFATGTTASISGASTPPSAFPSDPMAFPPDSNLEEGFTISQDLPSLGLVAACTTFSFAHTF